MQIPNVLVQTGQVLLDNECQLSGVSRVSQSRPSEGPGLYLVHFDGVVVEERSFLGHCSQCFSICSQLGITSDLHWASFCSFPIVAEMPLPISAAFRANSERRGCALPLPALPWASLSSLCAPGFAACFRCAAVTMWRNSAVRSFIATAMATDYSWERCSRQV